MEVLLIQSENIFYKYTKRKDTFLILFFYFFDPKFSKFFIFTRKGCVSHTNDTD